MTSESTGSTARSEELFERARAVTPGGVNSPVRAFRAVGFDGVISSCVFGFEEDARGISERQRDKALALVTKHFGDSAGAADRARAAGGPRRRAGGRAACATPP